MKTQLVAKGRSLLRSSKVILWAFWMSASLCSLGQTTSPIITTNPSSQLAFVGAKVEFEFSATGKTPFSYQWLKNSIVYESKTNSSLALTNLKTADTGTYQVIIANSYGSVTSSAAILTVFPPRMWVVGQNSSGQLGDGTLFDKSNPISPLGGAQMMAGGAGHSLFIKPDGTLWAMGNNGCGQIGDGSTLQRISPVQVAAGVTDVAACANQSFFIKADTSLWAMGYNASGQLGVGTSPQQLVPTLVASNVTKVAAGVNHALFLTSDGGLWSMGDNGDGQLGDGTTTPRSLPAKITTNVANVAAGAFHSLFVLKDGTLWGMGNNSASQLGDGTSVPHGVPVKITTNVTEIACGAYHSLFVRTDGTLWTMGDNSCGQLGDGTQNARSTPVKIANLAVKITAGFFFSLYVDVNEGLWAMGDNTYGELGEGTCQNQALPVRVAAKVKTLGAGSNHALFTSNILQPFSFVQEPLSQSVLTAQTVTLSAQLFMEPELSYRWQWFKNGTLIPGASSPSITLTNVQAGDTAGYSVQVFQGDLTNIISTAAQLVVLPYGAPTVWGEDGEIVGHVTEFGPTWIYLVSVWPNSYIFYTLDGSAPTFTSLLYNGPFVISNSVIVRAIALTLDFSQLAESPLTTIEVLPHTLSTSTPGGGGIAIQPSQQYYAGNAVITLTATADFGWTFMGWSGSASGTNNPLQVTMDRSKQISATFGTSLQTNILGQGGIVTVPSGVIPYGSFVQLTARPANGYNFVVWGNDVSGWNNPQYFRLTSANPVVGALFSTAAAGKTAILKSPTSVSISGGGDLFLDVSAVGTNLSYQWRYNGAPITGATSSNLAIPALGVGGAGLYDVVVSGTGGTVLSAAAYVATTEFDFRPVITVHGAPGMAFHIDYTDTLEGGSWNSLTAGALTNSTMDVIDFSNSGHQKRFYRVTIDN